MDLYFSKEGSRMELLKERIRKDGKIRGTEVL